MGGHVRRRDDCSHAVIAFNSCRNRPTLDFPGPRCQGEAARAWLAQRQAELLPIAYYHLVFTLPATVAAIAFQNKAVVYDILFKTASRTLATIAADPKHLGAKLGLTAVLHTWGRP
jgi:Transposase zinc-binding domain